MNLGKQDMSGWPEWINLLLATLSGVIFGVGTCVRWMWSLSDRVLTLESKVGPHSVAESLRLDRHDHVYPMIQERIILPLDMLEAEVKLHDRSIAILLERTRIEDVINRTVHKKEPE